MTASHALEIMEHLHELIRLFRARTRSGLEAAHPDLTFNEVRVLIHAGRHPGITHKDLLERSHTDKAQMTRIITSLEARNWLTRTPSEADKRVRCLHLSPQGLQLVQQLQAVQRQAAVELLHSWPPELQQAILQVLQTPKTP